MSTAHNGEYCTVKDKMKLSRQEARDVAARMGSTTYQCDECGTYHTTSRRTAGKRQIAQTRSLKRMRK